MYPRETVDRVLRLCTPGRTNREVAAATGVPQRTVAHWRSGDRRRAGAADRSGCARCGGPPVDPGTYAYLLGSYLGDGHITRAGRTMCLWIYCDDRWPGVRAEVTDAVRAVLPTSRVGLAQRAGCTAVKSYSAHWLCHFPQHGAGPKHGRPIVLLPGQQEVVDEHTGRFLRGLFHSTAAG